MLSSYIKIIIINIRFTLAFLQLHIISVAINYYNTSDYYSSKSCQYTHYVANTLKQMVDRVSYTRYVSSKSDSTFTYCT